MLGAKDLACIYTGAKANPMDQVEREDSGTICASLQAASMCTWS
jgi:hypothetical protein